MKQNSILQSFRIASFSAIAALILAACGGGSPATPTGGIPFTLSCNLTSSYSSGLGNPIVTSGTGTPTTSVIVLHGKNGYANTPTTVAILASDLNDAGYDVIRPNMPWANFNWDGDMCDAMAYLDGLIDTEITAGKSVILLGHSMAAPVVLSYAALNNTTKPDALVVVAPGHFVGTSSNFDQLHANEVVTAKNLVSSGNGNDLNSFQTSNGGVMQPITTTANIYLSFHDPAEFPDIRGSIPKVNLPTLWLAGATDPLTNSAINLGIIETIQKNTNYDYRVITGDHYTVVNNVTAELGPWYQGL